MNICEVCGVTSEQSIVSYSKKFSQTLCNKHYKHLNKYGIILERTKYDPNEYIYNNNYVEMCLYNKDNKEVARTFIDLEDVEKCKIYKWCLDNRGRVITISKKVAIFLHRFILEVNEEGCEVDHINHNTLDNQKSNLRICKHQENMMNQSIHTTNTSGITGVHWHKKTEKWLAKITYNYKCMYLGLFYSLEEAKQVRLEAEKKYFKEFSPNHNT